MEVAFDPPQRLPIALTTRYHRRLRFCAYGNSRRQPRETRNEGEGTVEFVLWLIAVILVIAGVVSLFRGAVLAGLALIIVGLLVGPGGVSVFT